MTGAALGAPTDLEVVRERFTRLARVECAGRSPLYAEICLAIASDDEVLELVLRAPPRQRRPTLLLAAIHDLLLSGVEHELAARFPTVSDGRAPAGSAGKLALAFCREHRDALARIVGTRSTQTNEVNRTAALRPALALAAPRGKPVKLVELGASAGLNLLVDRYAHCYVPAVGDAAVALGGPETSPVVCACAIRGELPALDLPRIAERVGVDLDPVDVHDARAARWLLACVWPDEPDRVARLRAAIELARRDPPTVVRGDALSLLPELVGPPRGGAHPVIWHSWVLAYWSPAATRALIAAIDELGAHRDLTWLYLEQPSETPALPTPVVAGACHDPADSALVAVTYCRGVRAVRRLADAHPHAHHMRWLAAA